MKFSISALCFICLGQLFVFSQQTPIKLFRYYDDFSYLLDKDSIDKRYYEKLKYLSLNKNGQINLSFGGEIREQFQYFRHANFGDLPPGQEADLNGHVWHRFMVHSDLRLGSQWRIFAQLNSTFAFGKTNLTPQIEEDHLSLHQAFIRWQPDKGKGFFAQVGRQECGHGSPFTIAVREIPNNRLTFDGILFGIEQASRKLYAFAATPVIKQQGVFDDTHIPEYLWSLYGVYEYKKVHVDAYYIGFYSENNRYNFQPGLEQRQTLGLRVYNRAREAFLYDIQGMYQFGRFQSQSISAYNLTANAGYKFLWKGHGFKPAIALNYISGDQSPLDEVLNTYNMLYSKPAFGLSIPIGAANLMHIGPSFEYNPHANIRLILNSHFIWRQSENDGVYTPGRAQVRPAPTDIFTITEKDIGQKYSVEWWYQASVNWAFYLEAAYLRPGSFTKKTGQGKPITYLSAKVSYKI